ncbi:MAG: hypothetical protein HC932_05705 [Thermales bacterium]|nr:hypothetical protein [Thermales bacterium]
MKILSKIFTIVLAVLIFLSVAFATVAFRLPQKETYQKAKNSVSLSAKLNELLSGDSLEKINYDKTLTFLIFDIVTNQLVTQSRIDDLIDKNFDLLIDWFNGSASSWSIYIPVEDINKELEKSLNGELLEFLEKNRSKIRVCSASREKSLSNNGIVQGETFCVPLAVRDGQITFTTFLGESSNNLLANIYADSVFENIDGKIQVDQIEGFSQLNQDLSGIQIIIRFVQRSIWPIILIVIVLVVLDLLWVYFRKDKILSEIRNLLFLSGLFGLTGMTLIIAFFGMSEYLSWRVQALILTEFATTDLVQLLSSWLYQVILELVLPLYWYFAGFLMFSIVILVIQRLGLFETVVQKNNRIKRRQSFAGQTLDSNFQTALKKENMLRSFGGNPLLHQYDQDKKEKELQMKLDKIKKLTKDDDSAKVQELLKDDFKKPIKRRSSFGNQSDQNSPIRQVPPILADTNSKKLAKPLLVDSPRNSRRIKRFLI